MSETVKEDFPAAHSMDSMWFAIDGEGNIGYFFTGEGGVLPQDAARVEHGEFDRWLHTLVGQPEVDYAIEDLMSSMQTATDRNYSSYEVLIVSESKEEQTALLAKCPDGVCLPSVSRFMSYYSGIQSRQWNQLRKAGLLHQCMQHRLEPGRSGIFEYDCEFHWDVGEPYLRNKSLDRPLHVNHVPVDLRAQLRGAYFADLNFAVDEEVYPLRYLRCFSWNNDM